MRGTECCHCYLETGKILFFSFYNHFWPHFATPSAVKARSPNHWTTREFPEEILYKVLGSFVGRCPQGH